MRRTVSVFGAYGHTGRFVVAELHARGWDIVLCGRDADALDGMRGAYPRSVVRRASVDDAGSLDRALATADVVINAAGPFAFTAGPVIEAALRARIPYLDLAAEIEANRDTFENYDRPAREAGVVIVPAMAFFGALGDLLATAALGDRAAADEIVVAYGLDSWRPTPGTRAAGRVSSDRRGGRRLVYSDGTFDYRTDAAPSARWTFPMPLGEQRVIAEFTMADTLTISRHIDVREIRSYVTASAFDDLVDADTGPPIAAGADGRSSQTFVVDVVARFGGAERRATASGRDIYACSAPLVALAAERVTQTQSPAGAYSAGEIFDAYDFLGSLETSGLELDLPERPRPGAAR